MTPSWEITLTISSFSSLSWKGFDEGIGYRVDEGLCRLAHGITG